MKYGLPPPPPGGGAPTPPHPNPTPPPPPAPHPRTGRANSPLLPGTCPLPSCQAWAGHGSHLLCAHARTCPRGAARVTEVYVWARATGLWVGRRARLRASPRRPCGPTQSSFLVLTMDKGSRRHGLHFRRPLGRFFLRRQSPSRTRVPDTPDEAPNASVPEPEGTTPMVKSQAPGRGSVRGPVISSLDPVPGHSPPKGSE